MHARVEESAADAVQQTPENDGEGAHDGGAEASNGHDGARDDSEEAENESPSDVAAPQNLEDVKSCISRLAAARAALSRFHTHGSEDAGAGAAQEGSTDEQASSTTDPTESSAGDDSAAATAAAAPSTEDDTRESAEAVVREALVEAVRVALAHANDGVLTDTEEDAALREALENVASAEDTGAALDAARDAVDTIVSRLEALVPDAGVTITDARALDEGEGEDEVATKTMAELETELADALERQGVMATALELAESEVARHAEEAEANGASAEDDRGRELAAALAEARDEFAAANDAVEAAQTALDASKRAMAASPTVVVEEADDDDNHGDDDLLDRRVYFFEGGAQGDGGQMVSVHLMTKA